MPEMHAEDGAAPGIDAVLAAAAGLGLTGVRPEVLNDAGNLTVRLAPHPVVARVAKLFPGDDAAFWRDVWARELRVAAHLAAVGVPAVPCADHVPPGPHAVGGTWMTLWRYLPPAPLPPLPAEQGVDMVDALARALADFPEPLPALGGWRNVPPAVRHLSALAPACDRAGRLVAACDMVDGELRRLGTLYPAHGDAHLGNLLPTAAGWRWSDFEDVSLMPRHWDIASLIGNTALLQGLDHPLVRHALVRTPSAEDRTALAFALRARSVMAAATNLSLALRGHGDLAFARAQLARLEDLLVQLDAWM